MPMTIHLESAEEPGTILTVEAHPQTVVMPGEASNTAVLNMPDGKRLVVRGSAKDIQIQIQAAAAQGHESGDSPRKNSSVS
jgi:hypothetical protein